MKSIVTHIFSFVLGVLVCGVVAFKVVYDITLEANSKQLKENLVVINLMEPFQDHEVYSQYKNALCDKFNWVQQLSRSSWSSYDVDTKSIANAEKVCKGVTVRYPVWYMIEK